jgi:integrase
MEFVEPIKDKTQIENIKKCLKNGHGKYAGSLRDWLLFTLGINSGLRISDLLKLTVEDVEGMDRISVKEKKTGKAKDFPLSDNCKTAIVEYLTATKLTPGHLFRSRNLGFYGATKSISRQQAYDIINSAARDTGIITKSNGVKIGCHSLRKTFGFHAYNNGVPIEVIQKLMNHSSPAVTLSYIGITKQTLDSVYINLNL